MPFRQCPSEVAAPKCSHSQPSVIWRAWQTMRARILAISFTTSQTDGKPGLKAEYFDNFELRGTPLITRTEEHIDFGTAARLLFPEQTLSSRWPGYYTPQDSGSYDIFVQTTREVGGSYRLYIDDKLVLDNWTTLTALSDYRTLRLEL